MIRKLMEKDREAVLTFLREEPLLNLFKSGILEIMGLTQVFRLFMVILIRIIS